MINNNRTKSDLFVGIDLGTGSLKVAVVDSDGVITVQACAEYPTSYPQPGWSQQNPLDWAAALQKAMQSVLNDGAVDPARIRAVGLCGMAHVPVLLDENDRVTYPAILWNDCRSGKEVELLEESYGNKILQRTANKPGCTWTLPQLIWLRKHVLQAVHQTASFLTAKDYLVYLLTGQKACDDGSATATMLYDFQSDEWAEELIEWTGLPRKVFPPVFKPDHIIGSMTKEATRFGFLPGTQVVLGCLDSVAEMIGTNSRKDNECVIRLGSAGAILSLRSDRVYTSGLLTYPFPFGNLTIKQAGTSSCGKSVDWSRSLISFDSTELETFSSIPPCCDGLIFHPFLQGERAPYHNPDLRGSFVGISAAHGRNHFARAVFEGVCFSIRDCFLATQILDERPDRLRIVGGGTRSPIWMSILADVLGTTLIPMPDTDSAFGMALFAAESVGSPLPHTESQAEFVFPDPKNVQRYGTAFEKYKEIALFLNSFSRKNI